MDWFDDVESAIDDATKRARIERRSMALVQCGDMVKVIQARYAYRPMATVGKGGVQNGCITKAAKG